MQKVAIAQTRQKLSDMGHYGDMGNYIPNMVAERGSEPLWPWRAQDLDVLRARIGAVEEQLRRMAERTEACDNRPLIHS